MVVNDNYDDVSSLDLEIALLQCMKNYKSMLEDSLLEDDKCDITPGEYYSDSYKEVLDEEETEDERKYRAIVNKQVCNNGLKILGKEEILTKEEVLDKIYYELEVYSDVYNLPILDVKRKEWECFFDVFYDILSNKGMTDRYYEILSSYIKNVLSGSIVNDDRYFQIEELLCKIDFLKAYDFNDEEIEYLCEKVKNVKDDNIIYFNNYKRR